MDHFDNNRISFDSDFDWSVFIDLFATFSAVMILMLGYIAYNKYQGDRDISLLTEQARIREDILSDFEKRNRQVTEEKQSLAKDFGVLQEALLSSNALIEQQKEKLSTLQKDQNDLKSAFIIDAERENKNFQKTYEAYKILRILDDSEEQEGIYQEESEMSGEVLANNLLSLAKRIEKAEAHKSLFKEKMAPLLDKQDKIEIVDDRFVLSSEILFPSGSAYLTKKGKKALEPVVVTLQNIVKEAPEDLDWIIRIDGHADRVRILRRGLSNRVLSAQRSLEIVKYLESRNIPAKRLVATAFGEHHPISEGVTKEDLARDRRIEIKITNR